MIQDGLELRVEFLADRVQFRDAPGTKHRGRQTAGHMHARCILAWLVIVAAEMLVGGTGIGYYVWNEWNNLDLASVIFAILMIGIVGMLLDGMLVQASRFVRYQD